MYIYPKDSRESPSVVRVAILTVLIIVGLWVLRQILAGSTWTRPFDPTPTPTPPAAFYINQGDINLAEGHINEAIKAYEQAIKLEPENDVPYQKQAELLIFNGDTGGALLRAEKALLLAPAKPENLARYCQALDWEGQYSLASDACECATQIDPSYAPAYAYLSEIYSDQNIWNSARITAQKAIAVDFQSPVAHHDMGYALEVQGRYREAVEFYENAITLRPKLAPYYLAAGQNYYSLGQFDKAIERFGQAIKLNPTDPVGYDQIGWAYHAKGEDFRAIDALEQAIGVDPTYARAWGRLAVIYYLRQNYEEAIKIFPTAINLTERSALSKIRTIEIFAEIQTPSGPEMLPVMRGRFDRDVNQKPDQLTATMNPLTWTHTLAFEGIIETCGHLIAHQVPTTTLQVSPEYDLSLSQAFSQTTGTATLSLINGEMKLDLSNVPRPQSLPYEVRVTFRPDRVESLSYVQPDGEAQIETNLTVQASTDAPLPYYYGLGLSYVYMEPPQCNEAIPWLLKALQFDASGYNPAWAGLGICPTENAPPTPVPTFTPIPEEASQGR